ncbi:MAG: segregation/condensation protein A [Elusimicrobiota bacterium]|jgi:segregation and condensation protein A|nr:segregation/condensation protein A [Elusimicrobiota bacterium]
MQNVIYDINIDAFEGPFDLLLHLAKKKDLEISEINIAEITSDYLSYLESMKELNIDIAGDFLVMASTLMQMKAGFLLSPYGDEALEEDENFDILKQRLLEYQKYKEVGKILMYKEIEHSQIYYRPLFNADKGDFTITATILDLARSFNEVFKALSPEMQAIIYDEIPIETKIREILDLLESSQYASFTDILKLQKTRRELIVSFMAVLELIKNKQISAMQSEVLGEIRIYKVSIEAYSQDEVAQEYDGENAAKEPEILQLNAQENEENNENASEESNGNI